MISKADQQKLTEIIDGGDIPEDISSSYKEFILSQKDDLNERLRLAKIRYNSLSEDLLKEGFLTTFQNIYLSYHFHKKEIKNFSQIFDRLVDIFLLSAAHKYYTGSAKRIVPVHMDLLFKKAGLATMRFGTPSMGPKATQMIYTPKKSFSVITTFT